MGFLPLLMAAFSLEVLVREVKAVVQLAALILSSGGGLCQDNFTTQCREGAETFLLVCLDFSFVTVPLA